jgi:hypothetical protein
MSGHPDPETVSIADITILISGSPTTTGSAELIAKGGASEGELQSRPFTFGSGPHKSRTILVLGQIKANLGKGFAPPRSPAITYV